jgi:AmiR/NasT family two-component response regulator
MDANMADALAVIDRHVDADLFPVVALGDWPATSFIAEAIERGVSGVIAGRDPDWQAALALACRLFAQHRELRGAFARRATIERANGILMERHSLKAEEGFAMLRHEARSSNRKLGDVAAAIVDGRSLLPAIPLRMSSP